MTKISITSAPDDGQPRMVTPALRARLRARVAAAVVENLASHPRLGQPDRLAAAQNAVERFFRIYPKRPVRDNSGGSQFNDSLWIYVIAQLLAPSLIVESGVHRGHSSWLLRRACPRARIHSFDINYSHLVYRDPKGRRHEGDWGEVDLGPVRADQALAFFDDHISHAQRVAEAYDRGFRHLLFDDNFPAETLYATGGPPIPTIDMVLDEQLAAGGQVRWQRKGKDYRVTLQADEMARARGLIAKAHRLAELGPVTRYSLGSGLTLVELVA